MMLLTIISLLPVSVSAQNWVLEPVDDVRGRPGSIAIDNLNRPHIAYQTTRLKLKYAKWNGITWEFPQLADTIGYSRAGKICIDNQNHPHIAYAKDSVLFKYTFYNGDSWEISTIDSCAVYNDDIKGRIIDMTLSENGIPHISYSFVDYADSVRGVRYAYQNGDSWIVKTVWQENRIPTTYLSQTYIELDRNGFPVVFFEANDNPGSARDTAYIFLARFDGQNWLLDTVDYRSGGDDGYNNFSAYSLKIDDFNRAHIFYQFDVSVVYGVQSGDTWRFEYLPGNAVGLCCGDMVLGSNNPRVVYSSVMRALTYGWRNENGDWEIEYILPNCPGLFPSIAIDSEGGMYVSFQKDDISGPLYYARRIATATEEEKACPIYKLGLPKELFLTISSPVSATI
ncbi:MAG: hypothetical protein ABIK42_06170 [candidate division WOR-3 bacterium]